MLEYKQLALIVLVPVEVLATTSCEFLLVLGLGCYYCGLFVGRVRHGRLCDPTCRTIGSFFVTNDSKISSQA